VLAEHTVGALLGVVTRWLDVEWVGSAQEMASTFERLTMLSVHAGWACTQEAPLAGASAAGGRPG
jgi:hypothetical protein